MKTYSTSVMVEAKHIDAGKHANWLEQLGIAQDVLFSFREHSGISLSLLQEHKLIFVMRDVHHIRFRKQLRLGDVIDVQVMTWISRPTCLTFHYISHHKGQLAMETLWMMPLVSIKSGRPVIIPKWMAAIVGHEKPTTSLLASIGVKS